jgi:hypothetical protein
MEGLHKNNVVGHSEKKGDHLFIITLSRKEEMLYV